MASHVFNEVYDQEMRHLSFKSREDSSVGTVTGYQLDYTYLDLIPSKSKSHTSVQWVLVPLFTKVKAEVSLSLLYTITKMVLKA
jgi:hypothetical protein